MQHDMGRELRRNGPLKGDGSELESGHERELDVRGRWSVGVIGGMQRVDDEVCITKRAGSAGYTNGFSSKYRGVMGRTGKGVFVFWSRFDRYL